jgi:hypothetical protein
LTSVLHTLTAKAALKFSSNLIELHHKLYSQTSASGCVPLRTTMSKSILPSQTLLLTFSKCLKSDKSQLFSTQCHRLSTTCTSTLPRMQQSCLRPTPRLSSRAFGTSSPRNYRTVQEQRSRYRSGVRFTQFPSTGSRTQLML